MSEIEISLHYSHCVKFTLDQLDREPFSRYESREVIAKLRDCSDWQCNDFKVVLPSGDVIASEESEVDAMAIAAYNLMAMSRVQAEKDAIDLEITLGNPKYAK